MIIDIHTHTFPPKIAESALRHMQGNCHTALFSDGTEEGLISREKKAGADLAVVQPVATNPEKVSHINDAVIRTNSVYQHRDLMSFGAMHPACGTWEEELERIREAGIAGIKLHPPYAGMDIDDPRSIAVLRKCRDLGMIVLIHSGIDVGLPGAMQALPAKIRRALDAVGPMRLIAGHMAGWGCWLEALELLPDTGIYLDTAFSLGRMTPAPDGYPWKEEELNLLDGAAFCDLVRAYGCEKVLFGTDSPWADPEAEIEKIRNLPLSEAEKEMILGGNAERLLREAGVQL